MPGAAFGIRGDGIETCIRVSGAIGGMTVAFLHRWSWDDLFTQTAIRVYASSDSDLVKKIMVSGGLWDASWQALNAQEVSARFSDWVSQNTTRVCEASTDAQWWRGTVLPYLQAEGDIIWGNLVDPGPPVNPTPAQQFPPTAKGIPIATTLGIAQATRLTLSPDPNNPSRILVGTIPVP